MCRTPLLPLLARQLGGAPETIGVVMAASTLTGVFVKLPAGAWSDILGRAPMLLLASAIFALLPFSYLAAGSLAGILIARGRFDVAFVVAGVTALLALPLILGALRLVPGASSSGGRRSRDGFRQGVVAVLRERRILVASVTHAAYFAINGTLNAFMPLFAQDRIGLGAADIGWLFGVQTVTTLAIRPLIGMASDRMGRRGAIAVGLVACAVSVFGISIATSRAELFTAVLMYAAGVAITTAATNAYITDVAPRARFGAAHGVFGTIYDIGDAGGPLVGGLMVAAWGYGATFQALSVVAACAAVAFIVLSRE